jgi:hypothetical protein
MMASPARTIRKGKSARLPLIVWNYNPFTTFPSTRKAGSYQKK